MKKTKKMDLSNSIYTYISYIKINHIMLTFDRLPVRPKPINVGHN